MRDKRNRAAQKSKWLSYVERFYKVILFSFKSFFHNECHLKAALLTFYTLIAIVPFLAFTLGIAKSFGFDLFLQREILATFKEQKDLLGFAMQFALSSIYNIQSGVIAGLGLLFLFVTIFGLLEAVESSLNAIWKITSTRNFLRRAVDYLAILIICPILFVISSGLTLFISAQVSTIFPNYPILREISPFILVLIQFAPYVLSWLLFLFIYLFVPNIHPNFKIRFIAAFIAGTLFQLWQLAYFEFQATITSYSTVYGSFAALPLFLIWMQVNYIIFLYGAEIAAYMENNSGKLDPTEGIHITPTELILLILHQTTYLFLKGAPPVSIKELSQRFGISLYKVREAANILKKAGALGELTTGKEGEEIYQLSMNPKLLTINKISELIDTSTEGAILAKKSNELKIIIDQLAHFRESAAKAKSNLHLKQIVESLDIM